jgi:hypothetical protein
VLSEQQKRSLYCHSAGGANHAAMPRPARSAPRLAELAALMAAVDWDERQPASAQTALDREVAPQLQVAGHHPVVAGRIWLASVAQRSREVQETQQRVDQILGWTHAGMVILGLLLGWLTTLGVFYYDGSSRVNVVVALAVLVVIPAVLLLPLLLAALPERIVSALPAAAPLAAVMRALSPGRLAPWLLRWMPQDWRETWKGWQGRLAAHRTLYGPVQKWTLLRWSQLFALAYQTAALLTVILLVVFTDLAFGWSTTLTTGDPERDAQRVHRATSLLALPWAAIVPDAAPSPELITESRYYRAAPRSLSSAEASRLGGWWRFVVLALAVYGWLPRLLMLTLAHARLRASARAAWVATPRLTAVLRRIRLASVQTVSAEQEQRTEAFTLHPFSITNDLTAIDAQPIVINWSAVPLADDVLQQHLRPRQILSAGGAATMEADQAVVAQLGADRTNTEEIVILVKAWEPPLLEFVDFVRSVRQALGRNRSILVLPVAVNAAGQPQAASESQTGVWQRKLTQLGDPWLRVAAFPREARS